MDSRIEKTLDFIENHLAERLDLVQLAQMALMSPSNFHKVFKEQTGFTPFKFIEKLKLARAYQLLLDEGLLVGELAEMLGYRDYETFSRAFKKCYALSPDDLRAIAQHVKAQANVTNSEDLVITSLDVDSLDQINLPQHLLELAQEKNISIKELKSSRVFTITQDIAVESDAQIVKNKFGVQENLKLWQALIKENSHE